jgi:4-diphosphocytidyl-2-C-methyl-D-erythritol kinase
VAFADWGDRLIFDPAPAFDLVLTGPFASALPRDGRNLVLAASRLLCEALPGRIVPARLTLEKHIPVAAGLGGGSADAAATLRGLLRLSGTELASDARSAIARKLGADVAMCLESRSCRATGIGDRLQPSVIPKLPALLVNPGVALATADVFRELGLGPGEILASPAAGRDDLHNDLLAPASRLAPVIGEVLAALEACAGLSAAGLSGSGATCFGLFATSQAAAEAKVRIEQHHPGWWCRAVTLGGGPQ